MSGFRVTRGRENGLCAGDRSRGGIGPGSNGWLLKAMCLSFVAVATSTVAVGQTSPAAFDHSLFDGVLKKYVTSEGMIDYKGLQQASQPLDDYIRSLRDVSLDGMPSGERLALLINAYNAFTIRLILDHYPVKSIQDISRRKRWSHKRWQIGGNTWSLDEIEHVQIRPKYNEPRIHFALVCAAMGCPLLRNEAYVPERLEVQLEDQTRRMHGKPKWFRFDEKAKTVYLTKLYKWYGEDFEKASKKGKRGASILAYAARYSPKLAAALAKDSKLKIEWLDYDWKLNDQAGGR